MNDDELKEAAEKDERRVRDYARMKYEEFRRREFEEAYIVGTLEAICEDWLSASQECNTLNPRLKAAEELIEAQHEALKKVMPMVGYPMPGLVRTALAKHTAYRAQHPTGEGEGPCR